MNEEIPVKKWHYAAIILVAGFLSILVMLINTQPSIGQIILYMTCSFIFLLSIFLILVPNVNTAFLYHLREKSKIVVLLINVVVILPLLNWIFSTDIFGAISSFSLWYLIPLVLIGLPYFIKNVKVKRFDFVFHIVAVLMFATGFDLRYTSVAINGFEGGHYEFNALWVSTLILLFMAIQNDDFKDKFNWQVTRNKLRMSSNLLTILSVILLPIGFLTGFFVWNPQLDVEFFLVGFIGIWLTIALPEEVIFRGVVQHQLTERAPFKENKHWKFIVLVVVSIVFGITHWNNTTAQFIWVYIFLATIAGIIYGICWWRGGLFSAMIVHTFIDWVWAIFFKL
ncbi:MAG: CPBP family intramembrane glutamic endopeptidase [Candidatus Thorarchaeota archaeon]